MKHVRGLYVVGLVFLMGRAGGIEPNSGYCIGNQCFTVFNDPSNFTTAQNQCRNLGGHLMTVRSSVSHDILFILLGNLTGQFWIGLHLPSGCPDAVSGLKGFQWVTKYSESDFFNWSPGFDSSCSCHRCVSVSPRSEFKWIQEPCGERAAGFLCEQNFTDTCKSLAVAKGESVTYMTPLGFGGTDMLSLPPGSTAVQMPSQTKYVCVSGQWLQGPWSCEINNGGCEFKCTVSPKRAPSCYCPPGKTVNPANKVTCDAATEDPCLALRCQYGCYNDSESYACMCDQGFKLAEDGRSCVEINHCADERQCPGKNFMCINNVGSFRCVCKEGYKTLGRQCVDEDECISAPCEHTCTNTPGGYKCSCYSGYKVDPKSPNKCQLHCGAEECPAECDPNDELECYCPDGYVSEERGDHTFCIDIDECHSEQCDQLCENTFGSYVCACRPGYTLVGQFRCVKSEDETHTDGKTATTPTIHPSPTLPHPDPTRQPSGVTTGALIGIIVFTVFFIVLVVFLVHHILCRRGKMESTGALKAAEGEAHGLEHVNAH
ncbi:thrombomodulin-like [Mastacembelus armatus]|uniref:thrombomodulin-like n=1 Tax=Mastacembelus armatus TaxID=205130 RepID=UPI000E45FE1B|nr:thrombomodulin-like [Mastacembelus armatus]